MNVFSFLPSPSSAGKSFGKPKDGLCIELITTIFQTKNNHFACLCVFIIFIWQRAKLNTWGKKIFSFDPSKLVCFTTRAHCVSILILTLGMVFICEHAELCTLNPEMFLKSAVESCLRGQWEYLHITIIIKT